MSKITLNIGFLGIILASYLPIAAQTTMVLGDNSSIMWGMTVDAVRQKIQGLSRNTADIEKLGKAENFFKPELHASLGSNYSTIPDHSVIGITKLMQNNVYGTNMRWRGFYFYKNKLYKVIEFYGSMDAFSGGALLGRIISIYGPHYRKIGQDNDFGTQFANAFASSFGVEGVGDDIELMWNRNRNLIISVIEKNRVYLGGLFGAEGGIAIVYFDPITAGQIGQETQKQQQQILEQEERVKQAAKLEQERIQREARLEQERKKREEEEKERASRDEDERLRRETARLMWERVEQPKIFTQLKDEMVFVHGGTFNMGCTKKQSNCDNDKENPVRSVTVKDFYIGKYEMTQKLWTKVMNGYNPSRFKGDDLPVERVSWQDIQEFLSRLNSATPTNGKRYRLPTEAEWEYAARGGTSGKSYLFAGGNNLGNIGWHNSNSNNKTNPVGSKKPNNLGIYDMSGNVFEWVNDWFGTYSSSDNANPRGPNSGAFRVIRGGSWSSEALDCRVSARNRNVPSSRYDDLGFRLVIDP